MPMTANHEIEYFSLGTSELPRIWTGLWQLSSNAWGSAPASKIRSEMIRYAQLGYTAFGERRQLGLIVNHATNWFDGIVDMARLPVISDHYGSSEVLFGQFRESFTPSNVIFGATKWCVFRSTDPTPVTVRMAIQERMTRMRVQKIDLLQFHWQDYSDKRYLNALEALKQLRDEGVIANIGLCNFDAIRTDEICTELGPSVIVTNQVQFSIIDTRPLHGMVHVCERHGVKLLTYGTLCGGFLSDRWLDQPEPDLYSGNLTPSQRKYLDMIKNAWGNWELFQSLLVILRRIGDRHGKLSIANIATRWVLDHSTVGAVIVGISDHADDNRKVFGFRLSEQDHSEIEEILKKSNSYKMIITVGDCGMEYR
ncbi:hypothetical protein QCA50_019140 [Cerrena zonata]|uniref:NADP-dependent oxidoreductase domain-containing protein n=1 Tax=Cerrena zonata TaxID=2478898 RepID=A0AAW0F9U5_9APHY